MNTKNDDAVGIPIGTNGGDGRVASKVKIHCRWRVLLVCTKDTYNVGIKQISDGAVETLEVSGDQEILSDRLGSQIQIQVGVRLQ